MKGLIILQKSTNFSFSFSSFCWAFGLFLKSVIQLVMKFSALTRNIRLEGSSVISLSLNILFRISTFTLMRCVADILTSNYSMDLTLRAGIFLLEFLWQNSHSWMNRLQQKIDSISRCLMSNDIQSRSLSLEKVSLILFLISLSKISTRRMNLFSRQLCSLFQMVAKTDQVVSMRLPSFPRSMVSIPFHVLAIAAYYFRKQLPLGVGFSMSCSCQQSYYYSMVPKLVSFSDMSFVLRLLASTALSYLMANREGSFILLTIGSQTLFKQPTRYFFCSAGLTLTLQKVPKLASLRNLDTVTMCPYVGNLAEPCTTLNYLVGRQDKMRVSWSAAVRNLSMMVPSLSSQGASSRFSNVVMFLRMQVLPYCIQTQIQNLKTCYRFALVFKCDLYVMAYRYISQMDKKEAPSQLKNLIKYLAASGGREKLCRLVQYFCRFLSTKYAQQYEIMISRRDLIGGKKSKVDSLMGASAMARKVLRFGPSINCIKTIIVNLNMIASGQVKEPLELLVLKTLSALFVGIFFICDHYLWLFKMGLVNSDVLRVHMEYWSSMGWLLDCIVCIIKNALLFSRDAKPVLQNKQLIIDSTRVVLDLVIAYSFVKPGSVNGKTVGLFGAITSLIGMYQLWG